MTLRMERDGKSCILTIPRHVSLREAQRFAEKSSSWVGRQMQKRVSYVRLRAGAEVPLRGEMKRIVATGKMRGLVMHEIVAQALHVPGSDDHMARKLVDWFKAEAKRDLQAASEKYASRMGVKVTRISIRDQKSRWGSCSSTGALSYSWRLILAPSYVLDYVAAHEVAHLREMNHGPRFWRLVLTQCPDTKRAKTWLKQNGRELHRYGA